MSRRKLSEEEAELWRKVTAQAERLHPELRMPDANILQDQIQRKPIKEPETRIQQFDVGQSVAARPLPHNLKPALSDRLSQTPVQMDRKAFGRMKRGKLVPEGRIDLHGMTLDRAHPALNRFILSAQKSGKRLVLVITGKGRAGHDTGPIPTPRGVLKHQVPQWLSMPPLSQAVMQVTEAHISHGGGGAYYVYLRKPR
jgi:DNA-nicking Smr family endonuclease